MKGGEEQTNQALVGRGDKEQSNRKREKGCQGRLKTWIIKLGRKEWKRKGRRGLLMRPVWCAEKGSRLDMGHGVIRKTMMFVSIKTLAS